MQCFTVNRFYLEHQINFCFFLFAKIILKNGYRFRGSGGTPPSKPNPGLGLTAAASSSSVLYMYNVLLYQVIWHVHWMDYGQSSSQSLVSWTHHFPSCIYNSLTGHKNMHAFSCHCNTSPYIQ